MVLDPVDSEVDANLVLDPIHSEVEATLVLESVDSDVDLRIDSEYHTVLCNTGEKLRDTKKYKQRANEKKYFCCVKLFR